MKPQIVTAEVIGPYVPWPHTDDADEQLPTAVNPARRDRGPTAHQADCQAPCVQAR